MRIATTLLLITTFAPAAMADEPPGAIRGKAFIAGSDRPAAGVTLHFFDREAPDRRSSPVPAAGSSAPCRPASPSRAPSRTAGGAAVLDGGPGAGSMDLAADPSSRPMRPAGLRPEDSPPRRS